MKKIKKKKPTRYPRVYRIGFYDERNRLIYEPINKFLAYRYVIRSGRRAKDWETFNDLEVARKHAGLAEEDVTPRPSGMMFRTVLARFLWVYRKKVQRPTLEKMRDHIRHFASLLDEEMRSIDAERMDRLIGDWTQKSYYEQLKSTRTSFFCELRSLAMIFRFYQSRLQAKDLGSTFVFPILEEHWKNVVFRQAKPGFRKDLLPEEFECFIAALERRAVRVYPYIATLARIQYLLGARVQEAAAIHYEDINAAEGTITMRRRLQFLKRKGQRRHFVDGLKVKDEGERVQPSREAVRIAREWCLKQGIRSGPIFLHRGEPLKYKSIQHGFNLGFKTAGLPQRGTHILRHAAITEFQETCKDIYLTKAFAGHTSVTTTEGYAKNRDATLRAALALRDERLEQKSLANVGQTRV